MVGRLHYTADVVVAIVITALLVTMNAPVWKLQFSFRKTQSNGGSAVLSAIEKVPSYLELCIERLNVFTVAVQESGFSAANAADEAGANKHAETWQKIDHIYAELGELIDQISRDESTEIGDGIDTNEKLNDQEPDTITAVFGEILPPNGDVSLPPVTINSDEADSPVSVALQDDNDKKPLINKV